MNGPFAIRFGIAIAVAIITPAWSLGIFLEAKGRAEVAFHNAALCEELSTRIIALKKRPAIAGTRQQAIDELAGWVESSAKNLGIVGDNLESISPEAPVRVADSAYLEQATTVQFRQVSLKQLIRLLNKLANDGSGLRIKSLRLTTPPSAKDADVWSVELTISYLFYSPLPTRQTEEGNS